MKDDRWTRQAESLARRQGGVISRRQLFTMGIPRWRTHAHVRARRWRRVHRQTIAVHTGPLPPRARQWTAVFEAGNRGALDGASSANQVVSDALRQNDVTLAGDLVLRLPLLGLRAEPDAFFAQISSALESRGWQAPHNVIPSGVHRPRAG